MTNLGNERGGLMGFALVTAMVASIAAYATLISATTQARIGRVFRDRARARYAAEAGVVWARERLWRDPAYCGEVVPMDTDANGSNDTNVEVTLTSCGPGNENQPHIIRGRVLY